MAMAVFCVHTCCELSKTQGFWQTATPDIFVFAGLSEDQNDLLREFGFKQHTYLPSTFAKQQLNSKQPTERTQTEVIYGEYDEFFEKIVKEIEDCLGEGRAILIVFADKQKMDRYYGTSKVHELDVILYFTVTSDHFCRCSAALNRRNPDHPGYSKALELKDELGPDKRTGIVFKVLLPFCISTMLPTVTNLCVLIYAHAWNGFRPSVDTRSPS